VQEKIQRRKDITKPRKHQAKGEERREYLFQPVTRCPPAMDSFCRLCLLKKTKRVLSPLPFLVIVVYLLHSSNRQCEKTFFTCAQGLFLPESLETFLQGAHLLLVELKVERFQVLVPAFTLILNLYQTHVSQSKIARSANLKIKYKIT
jgi:hypothetical protein